MSSSDDYDNLSKEEREARDKEDRAREAAEQASASLSPASYLNLSADMRSALPYTWTQLLGEVDVSVPVPEGTKGKQLSVVIQKKKLSVGLKGQPNILEGELCQEIKVEDSTWTLRTCPYNAQCQKGLNSLLDDNRSVQIHLEKLNKERWWENVLTHHPKIDTKKIEPSNSKLSDLDGETR
jgi:hypothetical protein